MRAWESFLKMLFILVLYLILAYAVIGYPEFGFVRPIGEFYAYHSFNPKIMEWWSASPNVVTGLLWDYRGFDTLFETMVFYIGVVAVAMYFERHVKLRKTKGMSLIVRTSTRFVFIFILTSAIAITVFSVKTPGGGFQGGSIIAISYLVVLIALSRGFIPELGLDVEKAHMVKILGLIIISTLALTPIIYSMLTGVKAFALQNQPKPWAPFGFPAFLGLRSLSGGNIIPIQLGEMLHVGMGFTIIFLLLTLKEVEE